MILLKVNNSGQPDAPAPRVRAAAVDPAEHEDDAVAAPAGGGLFPGDSGELALDTRRVLVSLLTGPYLDGARDTKLWPVLLRDEDVLRRRLSELFLDLTVDLEAKAAFIRRADTGGVAAPQILRQRKLTFLDSVLVLFLRQQLMQSSAKGERAVISFSEISEHLQMYQRATSLDQAGFAKRINAAISRAHNYNLLQKIPKADGRFEISPTLRILFMAEQVSELMALYARLRDGEGQVAELDTDDDAEDAQ